MFKTLGAKHKCSVAQIFAKGNSSKSRKHSRIGKIWYYTIGDTGKEVEVFNIKDVEYKNIFDLDTTRCNDNCNVKTINIRSSALKKLIAENCEVCGKSSDDVSIVLHHWNPIRNIPDTDTIWDRVYKMRQRKTIAVCHECHMRIHHG
jgi:RNA-directed DNA polymerase